MNVTYMYVTSCIHVYKLKFEDHKIYNSFYSTWQEQLYILVLIACIVNMHVLMITYSTDDGICLHLLGLGSIINCLHASVRVAVISRTVLHELDGG